MTGETQQPRREPPIEQSPEAPAEQSTARRAGSFAATAGSPKLRAVALILSFSVLLITIVCAPFGALPWWSPILMLVVTGGVFAWCRASAMAATAERTPVGTMRPTAAPRTRSAQPAPGKARTGVKLPKRKTPKPSPTPVPALAKATMPEPIVRPATEQVYDVSASATPAPQYVAPITQPGTVVAQADEAAWEPVAVPPPTYTMKERAPERPEQAPAATSAKSYEHVANEDLPFDGLALDQDLDDLPSVFRAG